MVEQEKVSWLLHLTSSFNLMAVNPIIRIHL